MDLRPASRWFVPIAVFGMALSSAREVSARPCSADADCPRGFMCLPSGTTSDGGLAQRCVSLSCQSDSDCGPGTRCDSNTGTQCVPSPDGGQSCGPASACAPQWEVQCSADVDCGPGFTCSGSSGFYACGPKQADAPVPSYATVTVLACADVPKPPAFAPHCGADAGMGVVCTPSICEPGSSCLSVLWKTCVAAQTPTCTVDSDCPLTWTCQSPASGSVSLNRSGIPTDAAVIAPLPFRCVAPNTDLSPNADLSFGGPGVVAGLSTQVPDAGGSTVNHGRSEAMRIGPSPPGGCQLSGRAPTTGSAWVLFMALGCASWTRVRQASTRRQGATATCQTKRTP